MVFLPDLSALAACSIASSDAIAGVGFGKAGVGRSEFNQRSDPKLAGLIEQRLRLMARLGAKANARTKLLSEKHTAEQIAGVDKDIDDQNNQREDQRLGDSRQGRGM